MASKNNYSLDELTNGVLNEKLELFKNNFLLTRRTF